MQGTGVIDEGDGAAPRAVAHVEKFTHRQDFALEHGLRAVAGKANKVKLRLCLRSRAHRLQRATQQLGLQPQGLGDIGRLSRRPNGRTGTGEPNQAGQGAEQTSKPSVP